MLKEPTQKTKEEKFRGKVFQAEVKVVSMSLAKTRSWKSFPAVPMRQEREQHSGRSESR